MAHALHKAESADFTAGFCFLCYDITHTDRSSKRILLPFFSPAHVRAVARALRKPTFDCCVVRFDVFKQPVPVHLGRENILNSAKCSNKVTAAYSQPAAVTHFLNNQRGSNHHSSILKPSPLPLRVIWMSFGWCDVCGEVKVKTIMLASFPFPCNSFPFQRPKCEGGMCFFEWGKGAHNKTCLHRTQRLPFSTFITYRSLKV